MCNLAEPLPGEVARLEQKGKALGRVERAARSCIGLDSVALSTQHVPWVGVRYLLITRALQSSNERPSEWTRLTRMERNAGPFTKKNTQRSVLRRTTVCMMQNRRKTRLACLDQLSMPLSM